MPISSTYTISNTQGNLTFNISVGIASGPLQAQQNADLTFYGYGCTGWGQQVDQNFYRLLENFACAELNSSPTIPKSKTDLGGQLGINDPIIGQQWFNLSSAEMYVCSDPASNTWKHLISEDWANTYLSTLTGTATNYIRLDGTSPQMTGYLNLIGPPRDGHPTDAATKGYVDTLIGSTSSIISSTVSNYVLKTGDTMTGGLVITAPTSASFISATTTPTFPLLQLGNGSVSTQARIEFITNGSSTNQSASIVATGGTSSVVDDGTLTLNGFIMLDRDPTLTLQAATKGYVDNAISTSIYDLASTGSTFLLLTGGTMSGTINLGGNTITNLADPVYDTDAATKQYSDNIFYARSGTSGIAHVITTSSSAPSGGNDGDIWFQL